MNGDSYAVLVQSQTIDRLGPLSDAVTRNLVRAVNKTIERARPEAARQMREQVAFPARYLSSENGRLTITKKATGADPSAILRGRHRPTSLARFARNARTAGQRGARVEVQPGLSQFLPRAFFINLRSGTVDAGNNNLGLAIRLPEGQSPNRAYKPKQVAPGLWLLYGPSVDQVFDDVALAMQPDSAEFLEREFLRLTDLDLA